MSETIVCSEEFCTQIDLGKAKLAASFLVAPEATVPLLIGRKLIKEFENRMPIQLKNSKKLGELKMPRVISCIIEN